MKGFFKGLCQTNMKKVNIKNRYAIWIDHHKAIMLCADAEGNLTEEDMVSSLVKRERFAGEVTNKTNSSGHVVSNESHRQHKEENDFHKFLKVIVSKLSSPEGLLILGPGDARHELQNEVENDKSLHGLSLENRPADKMTDIELTAAMKDYFHLS
jgi:hypothetical protein